MTEIGARENDKADTTKLNSSRCFFSQLPLRLSPRWRLHISKLCTTGERQRWKCVALSKDDADQQELRHECARACTGVPCIVCECACECVSRRDPRCEFVHGRQTYQTHLPACLFEANLAAAWYFPEKPVRLQNLLCCVCARARPHV